MRIYMHMYIYMHIYIYSEFIKMHLSVHIVQLISLKQSCILFSLMVCLWEGAKCQHKSSPEFKTHYQLVIKPFRHSYKSTYFLEEEIRNWNVVLPFWSIWILFPSLVFWYSLPSTMKPVTWVSCFLKRHSSVSKSALSFTQCVFPRRQCHLLYSHLDSFT